MGNRAVITLAPYKPENPGIYVHWNGGRASVEGFLKACRELKFRGPGADPSYAMARLTQAVCLFFPDGLSVGVGACSGLDCDNGDNGLYEIGDDWQIVGRHFRPYSEIREEVNEEKTGAIAAEIVQRYRAVQEMAKDGTISSPRAIRPDSLILY